MTYPIARPTRLSLDGFARQAGLHPELVRRFVALGLVDAYRDANGRLKVWPTGDADNRPGTAAPGGTLAELRSDGSGARPAGSHRRRGGSTTHWEPIWT
jgi:hypothetical protein